MPTRYPGNPVETAALDAYIKLMRAAEALTARVGGVMAAAGLTIGQFGALEALLHHGPLCQRDLGQKLLRSDANTAVVVGNLLRRGLVQRTRRRDDRRYLTVALSEAGRRLITDIFPRHVAGLVREMGMLSRDEQDALGRLCRRLGLAEVHAGERKGERAMEHRTRFGSLQHYDKGGVEVINDDARNYVFSNIFEVASRSKPYEKVAVGKNIEYVIEAIRAEGTSGWRAPAQDEFALVMDGEVEIRLLKLDKPGVVPRGPRDRWALAGHAGRQKMGVVRARRGHMTLLPVGQRLSVPRREARRGPAPDPRRRRHRRALGGDLPDRSAPEALRREEETMSQSTDTVPEIGSIEPNQHGYRTFTLGEFAFSRDEYFVAGARGPRAATCIPADAFLRALQRDIAWGFFYGIVNFDAVVGTVNHYGSVDLFAGRFNAHYRKAGLDHSERFPTPLIQRVFEAMLDDWTNKTSTPSPAPRRRAAPSGPRTGATRRRSPATASPPSA